MSRIIVRPESDFQNISTDAEVMEGRELRDEDLLKLLRFRKVRRLDLAACEELTDTSVSQLAMLPHLEALDLSLCNQVTDESIVAIAKRGRLRQLNLMGCYFITDRSLDALGSCDTLELLNLANCEEISDVGVAAVAELPSLKCLVLPEFAPITDRGLLALAASRSPLQELSLVLLGQITNVGLQSLCRLVSLRKMVIKGCDQIKPDTVEQVRRALPNCDITYSDSV